MRILAVALAFAAFTILGAFPATADDWQVVKLRGVVMELIDGEWQRLERGDVVPDDRVIRTLGGRVTLVRGGETIDLGSNTQIQIIDKEARRPFTTVMQYFGTVGIEAEVRDVQHFAVQTPYLVAVVKGTRFVVTSGETSSEVKVQRGAVEVNGSGSDTHTVIVAGQSAGVEGNQPLQVAGRGHLPEVVDANGNPVNDGVANGNVNGNIGNGNGNGGNGSGIGVGVDAGNGIGVGVGVGNGNGNGNGNGSNGNGVDVSVEVGNGVGVEVGVGNGLGVGIGLGN